MSDQPLAGRVALVTGASRGIGRAIAIALGAAGAKVAVCSSTTDGAEAAAADVPGEAAYFQCDVSDRAAVDATVKAVVERFGALDILIANAGVAIDGLLMRTKPEQWDKTMAVNLTGTFNCCKAVARHLLKSRENGRIVVVSSVVGEAGSAGQSAYAASKAGLLGLARSLALELAGRGITVNAVTPGFIETRMTETHVKGDRRDQLIKMIPLGRIGRPEDVAGAVRFLCSPEAAYITGQVIRVNGGLYL